MDRNRPLTVRVDSNGGSVFESIAIYNLIAEWPSEVITYISSLAASAASVIAMVGDKRLIADNARMMVHHPWIYTGGNAVELRAIADLLDSVSDGVVDMHERKSNLSRDEIGSLLDGKEGADGTYLSAKEVLEAGFCTEIVDTSREKANNTLTKNEVRQRLVKAKLKISGLD